MTEIIESGWDGLYRVVDKCYRDCWAVAKFPSLQTQWGGEIMGPKGNRRVLFKCGADLTFTNSEGEEVPCTGYVDGLTTEQARFLKHRDDKIRAVQAVGPNWPGRKEAMMRYLRARRKKR